MNISDLNNPSWDEPELFALTPAPSIELPENMHGHLIGEVAEMFHTTWGIPPLLTCTTALGVACAATGGRAGVRIGNGAEFPLALYLMALSPPGSMKSPHLAELARPLTEKQAATVEDKRDALDGDRAQAEALRAALKRLGEALSRSLANEPKARKATEVEAEIKGLRGDLRKLEDGGKLDGVDPVVMGGDMTYEAFIKRAERTGGRVAVLSAEAGLFENLAGRYSEGNTKTEFLNSAYDGEPFDGERVSDGQRSMRKPWATLLLTVQPDAMATVLRNEHMRRRGFLQRILPVEAPAMPYRPRHSMPRPDSRLMDRWSAAVSGIWHRMSGQEHGQVRALDASGPQCEPLRAFEDHTIAGVYGLAAEAEDGLMLGWLGKLAGTTTRIAAVLTLLENPEASAVSESAALAAGGYAGSVIEHARHLFTHGPAHGPDPRLKVLECITRKGFANIANTPGRFSTREVYEKVKGQTRWCDSTETVRGRLLELAELGWVRAVPPEVGRTGRPSEQWDPHPNTRHHFERMTASAKHREGRGSFAPPNAPPPRSGANGANESDQSTNGPLGPLGPLVTGGPFGGPSTQPDTSDEAATLIDITDTTRCSVRDCHQSVTGEVDRGGRSWPVCQEHDVAKACIESGGNHLVVLS